VLLRARRQARDETAVVDSTIDAINQLVDAHRRLEAGQAVDFALITQQVTTLRTIVDDINKSLNTKSAS
jgi:hypothetical protein